MTEEQTPDEESPATLATVASALVALSQSNRYVTDRLDRERFYRRWMTRVGIAALIIAVLLAWQNRLAIRATNRTQALVVSCVIAPAQPSPPNRLTCFERSQAQQSTAISELVSQFDAVVAAREQQLLNAIRSGQSTIPATVVIPKNAARTGPPPRQTQNVRTVTSTATTVPAPPPTRPPAPPPQPPPTQPPTTSPAPTTTSTTSCLVRVGMVCL